MSEPWTLRSIIGWIQSDLEKRGFSAPRLDADLIVARALGVARVTLYLDLERPLIDAELATIRGLVERRRRHEPMAYLLGEREFFGHTFAVNPDVLIPRPDTEVLVERALALLSSGQVGDGPILDVCTGSGAIALSILRGAEARSAVATDLSPAALDVARANAQRLGVSERVRLVEGDLFAPLASEQFALIAINPPYIGTAELATLMPDVRDFEPRMALDAGGDALSFYRRIAREVGPHLMRPSVLLMEVGSTQAREVAMLFREAGFADLSVHLDYGGNERVVEAWLR